MHEAAVRKGQSAVPVALLYSSTTCRRMLWYYLVGTAIGIITPNMYRAAGLRISTPFYSTTDLGNDDYNQPDEQSPDLGT